MKRALVGLGLALWAPSLPGQSILDAAVRVGPQFVQYKLGAPSSTTISEFSVPLFVTVPVLPALTVDVGTAFSRAHVEQTSAGPKRTSDISGLTDTQIRANYAI